MNKFFHLLALITLKIAKFLFYVYAYISLRNHFYAPNRMTKISMGSIGFKPTFAVLAVGCAYYEYIANTAQPRKFIPVRASASSIGVGKIRRRVQSVEVQWHAEIVVVLDSVPLAVTCGRLVDAYSERRFV